MPVQATAALIVMVKLATLSCVGLSESVTVTEKVGVVPGVAGAVPESTPVEGLMESQDGLPLRPHV